MRSFSTLSIILIIVISFITCIPGSDSIETIGQSIHGRVTDSKTGEPIPGAEINFMNRTKDIYLWGVTDDKGEYSIQVGTSGNFTFVIWHENHWYNASYVQMEWRESKEFNMEMRPYLHNVICHVYCGLDGPVEIAGARGTLWNQDPQGNNFEFVVDENLYFEVDVDPGSYIAEIHKVGFTTDNDLIKVHDRNTTFKSIKIYPRSIDRYTSDIFIDTFIDIPPRSYAVYTFNVTELCNMFMEVSSDQKVHILVQTNEMYLNYLEWPGKGSFEFERPWDHSLFDFAYGSSRHTSMDIVAWSDPFHIIIENNNSVSTRTYLTLRYKDANLEDQGFEVHPLDEDNIWEEEDKTSAVVAFVFLLLFIVILFFIVLKHRSNQQKTVFL